MYFVTFLSYQDNVLMLELSTNNRHNVFENRLGAAIRVGWLERTVCKLKVINTYYCSWGVFCGVIIDASVCC